MFKYLAVQVSVAMLAVWVLLHFVAVYSGVDAQLILIAGIALSSFGTAVLTVFQQYTLNKVKKTGEATHLLSNSAMGEKYKDKVEICQKLAVLAHRLAEYTKQPEADAAALVADVDVEKAKRDLQEHLIRQAKVDAVAAVTH